jgi:hypothetical protein
VGESNPTGPKESQGGNLEETGVSHYRDLATHVRVSLRLCGRRERGTRLGLWLTPKVIVNLKGDVGGFGLVGNDHVDGNLEALLG